MIQQQALTSPADRPGVPGDLGPPIEHHQLRGPQRHPHPPPDQPGRHRVVRHPHHHPGVPFDPRRQRQPRVDALGRQRPQQGLLEGEVVPDRERPVVDAPTVLGRVDLLQPGVELDERRDLRHGDEVVTPEPADLALHPALLVRALDPGQAVEGVEAVVRPEHHPPVGFGAVTAEQHAGDGTLEIVVADLVDRGAAQDPERLQVAFDERLLPLAGIDAVNGLA